MRLKFKVGDKVRFKRDYFHDIKKGDEATIVDIATIRQDTSFPYLVYQELSNKNKWAEEEVLELVHAQLPFVVGDKVEVNAIFYGATQTPGVVAKVDQKDTLYPYRIKFEDGSYLWLKANQVVARSGGDQLKKYIVAVMDAQGKFEPNSRPRHYDSAGQAEKVALSMSKRHGKSFAVLQAVSVAESPAKPEPVLRAI